MQDKNKGRYRHAASGHFGWQACSLSMPWLPHAGAWYHRRHSAGYANDDLYHSCSMVFARSSPKFEARLLADPRFGPLIIKWRERGAIPPKAKLYACLGMAFGYGMFWWGARPGPLLAVSVTIFMLGSAAYVLSRPSE